MRALEPHCRTSGDIAAPQQMGGMGRKMSMGRPEGAIGRALEERKKYRPNQRLAATGGGDGTEAGGASGAGTSPSSFSVPAGYF